MRFEEIEINEKVAKAVKEIGFTELTEIQELAVPFLLENDSDFVGQAQTGTGKTAAFALPLLHKLDATSQDIQALVLVPTRELALQVHQDIEKIAKYTKIRSQVIQGGVSYDRQIGGIRKNKPQIIVGTPGRVTDLINKGVLNFDKTRTIILDEADEMLNMGFLEAVQEIFSLVSKDRKIWMFSATMPREISQLIKKDFNNPHTVSVKKNALSAEGIEQKYYLVNESRHLEALCRILDSEPDLYGIVFCRTRLDTKEVYEELMTRGYEVETLHGELGQNLRDSAMAKFKKKKVNLMICTDVAARGIDVNNLTHVINYGLPQDSESYVHRIGRTGRAGLKGTAITLIDSRALGRLRRIEVMIKQKINYAKLPTVDELKKARVQLELQSMTNIAEMVLEKGEDFKVDANFSQFEEAFAAVDKEEALKIFFAYLLNGELRHYETLGDLNEEPKKLRSRSSERPSFRERAQRDKGDRSQGKSFPKERSGKGRGEKLVRLFLDKGKKDGLHLKVFLRELSRQTGVKENNIHNVVLNPQFSFIDVSPDLSKKIMSNKSLTLLNKSVKVELAT